MEGSSLPGFAGRHQRISIEHQWQANREAFFAFAVSTTLQKQNSLAGCFLEVFGPNVRADLLCRTYSDP